VKSLTLFVGWSDDRAKHAPFASLGGSVTLTLLAVDDSKTMRKVVEITFAGEDCRTILADSPSNALAKLRTERPTIALVDAILGSASGYDLCQELKAESPSLGVIIFSSKQHPYDRSRGSAVGADDFIDKPFDSQALIDKVASVSQRMASLTAQHPARPTEQSSPAHAVPPARPLGAVGAPFGRPQSPVAFGVGGGAAGGSPGLRGGAAGTGSALGSSPGASSPEPAAAPQQTTATFGRSPLAGKPVTTGTLPGVPPPEVTRPAVAAPATVAKAAPPPAAAVVAAPAATRVAAAPGPVLTIDASLEEKLGGLGLTQDQMRSVLALSREVIEQVVWEVVPVLAETMIREEIRRLTSE
jgi:CheY-like chemotaxis protein